MSIRSDHEGDPAQDAAWALYHENSRRGRRFESARPGHDGQAARLAAAAGDNDPGEGAVALPAARTLIRIAADAGAATGGAGGPMPLVTLASILATVCRPAVGLDPIRFLLHAEAVEALPAGLYRSDGQGRFLIPLAARDPGRRLAAAMPEVDFPGRVQAVLFFVGMLEAAAEAEGERGYRRALMAAGRHALALDLAAAAAGVACREVSRFFDREVDALLGLDGLAESVLHAVTLGAPGDAGE